MDTKSQFASRYKTDMSIDNLRAKVARRKSIAQKENRHKEFRKGRGLEQEQDLTMLEEVNETFHAKGSLNKTAVPVKNTDIGAERRVRLQRYLEEKQLRKLKEQREKASKGVFKCGIYRPETSFIPVPASQQAAKVKPKEKPAPPAVTRITRSAAKIEAPLPNTRSRLAQVPVLNKVSDRAVPKGRGQTSVLRKNEKESKATAIPSTRTTRAMAAATSRLPTATGAVKNTSEVVKPQRTKANPEREIASTKPEKPAVLDLEKKEKMKADATIRKKVMVEVTIKEAKPEAILETIEPEVSMEEQIKPEVGIEEMIEPEVNLEEKVKPEDTMEETKPEVGIEEMSEPEVTMEDQMKPEISIKETIESEATVEEKVKPEVTIGVAAVKSEIPAEKDASVQEEQKPSFAPENFVFQPLDGLSNFKFQPMTPKRANAFLTPTFTWSPVDGKSNFVFTRDREIEENKTPQVSPPDFYLKTTNDELKMDTYDPPEAKGDVSVTLPVGEQSPPTCDQNASTPTDNAEQLEETPHDVPYFRGLLKSEIQKLSLLCTEWDKRIDMAIPEDAKDLIRTTVGQTRLLMTERFKQFEGLVDNCEFKLGEKETTCTDLDGFWDMIYFQIEDVSKKFVNLKKLEEHSWQQTTVQAKKVVRKKNVPAATVNKSQGDNGRAAARSRLAAIKAAMRNRVKQEDMVEEALVSEQPMQVDPVVFDAGFFRIESPAKVPGSRRTKTPSQTSGTPKSTKKNIQDFAGADRKVHNSDNPVNDRTEEGANHIQIQKSPSPAKSPVRKALFDPQHESLQSKKEEPVAVKSENTESEMVPQAVDLEKYLVHTIEFTDHVVDSPIVMEFSRLGTELEGDTKFEFTPTVEDVFMCSPEKAQETNIPSPKDNTVEILPEEGIQNLDNPLDFLGSSSNMVTHTPLKSESVSALSDLMVFSPMEM